MVKALEVRHMNDMKPGLRSVSVSVSVSVSSPSGPASIGTRPRGWRILVAHDAHATTCDGLLLAVERAFSGTTGNIDVTDASSADDARAVLQYAAVDACLVCLDLPPAPLGGVRFAQEVLELGIPVVLVTRSLRWIPASATDVRDLPWIAPDATDAQVHAAITGAAAARLVRDEVVSSRGTRFALR
jgi:hypothetical protein